MNAKPHSGSVGKQAEELSSREANRIHRDIKRTTWAKNTHTAGASFLPNVHAHRSLRGLPGARNRISSHQTWAPRITPARAARPHPAPPAPALPIEISCAKASEMSSRGRPTAMHVTILSTASSSRSPLNLGSEGSFSKKSENTYSVARWAIAMAAARRGQPDRLWRAGPGTAPSPSPAAPAAFAFPFPVPRLLTHPLPDPQPLCVGAPGSRRVRPGAGALALARPPPARPRALAQYGFPAARAARRLARIRRRERQALRRPLRPAPGPEAAPRRRPAPPALRSPRCSLPGPWASPRARARGVAGNRGDAGGVGAAPCGVPGIRLRRSIFALSSTSKLLAPLSASAFPVPSPGFLLIISESGFSPCGLDGTP